MQKSDRFTFRASESDLERLAFVGEKLQRNPSDALRFLISSAARQLSDPTQGQDLISNPFDPRLNQTAHD